MGHKKRGGRSRWKTAAYKEDREIRLREQGWHSYKGYTRSKAWKERRARWYRDHPNAVCYVCLLRDGPLILHHRTYKRLGDELDQDLIPLCDKHHRKAHWMYTNEGVALLEAHEAVRRAYRDRLTSVIAY